MDTTDRIPPPSFKEALLFWLKLGFISFGGPGGQIAIMHTELVEKKKWISEARFLHALNFCMLLPGPEAQQLATYLGWLLHRTWGGLVAGILFVLPSVFILWALSSVYVFYGNIPWVAAIFYGLKPAVLAIVLAAAWKIGKRSLKNSFLWTLAGLSFISIFFLHLPFPLIIFCAALAGLIGAKLKPDFFAEMTTHGPEELSLAKEDLIVTARPTFAQALLILTMGLTIWWFPILLTGYLLGWDSTLFQAGLFFSKAAMVTFGGAYAVLPYVAQQAVETYQWLKPEDILAGMALAETTPGPLIMVLQFYGFLAGWNHPDLTSLFWSASCVGFMSTWATFVPCFLYIFLGAPYVESLRHVKLLNAALSAVTAAVVGVILNLALWFGLHVLLPAYPEWTSIDGVALSLALASFIALQKFKVDILLVLPIAGFIGGLVKLLC
jgi:chromate transporter